MVKRFKAGKYYKCILTGRPDDWNRDGKMDAMLDGKPRRCVQAIDDGYKTFMRAAFEGISGVWAWGFDEFEEVSR